VRLIQERETLLAALRASIIRGLADAVACRVTPAAIAFDRVESTLRSRAGNEAVQK
jgi:antitoxin ParD1/3/4